MFAPSGKEIDVNTKALLLYFRLNSDAMNYTPRSHRGQRAVRLMPLIRAKYLAA